MTTKEFVLKLLTLAEKLDENQEIYIKNGSSYDPVIDIILDIDNGLLIVENFSN